MIGARLGGEPLRGNPMETSARIRRSATRCTGSQKDRIHRESRRCAAAVAGCDVMVRKGSGVRVPQRAWALNACKRAVFWGAWRAVFGACQRCSGN